MVCVVELYGGGLYDLAAEEQQEQEILAGMKGAQALFHENPKYVTLLSEPNIPRGKRLELLDQAFCGETRPYLLNLLKLITKGELLSQYEGMCRTYERRFNAAYSTVTATVHAAIPFNQGEHGKLKEAPGKRSGERMVLREMLDAGLLDDIMAEIDGETLDGSVAGCFPEIRKKMEEIVL